MPALLTCTLLVSLSACGGSSDPIIQASDSSGTVTVATQTDETTAQALNASKTRILTPDSAPGYYIDSVRGNDANNGAASSPWRTLARASTVQLATGQGLYLRCGQVWRESLSVGGLRLAKGVVIAGYGPECSTQKARLSGADDLSGGWAQSGDVWSKSLPAGTPKITQLFINGKRLRTAQWPNTSGDSRKMALLAAADTALAYSNRALKLTPADAQALAGRDLAGATIQIRTQPWMIETHQVASASAQHLLLKAVTRWDLRSGQGFVLQDKRWMLDEAGEFFHDTAAQTLHFVAQADFAKLDVNSARVEGSVRDEVLVVSESLDLEMRDIEVHGARDTGLRLTNSPGARLQRVDAHANAVAGARLQQWTPLTEGAGISRVEEGSFIDNGQYGIEATHVRGALISRNRVLDTGVGLHHQINVIAAISAGPAGHIESNIIEGAGYAGIMFSSHDGSKVADNRIAGYCTRLTDCGAIYTWTGREGMQPGQASQVTGNTITGGSSNLEGMALGASDFVAGIYIDDFSNGALIADNLLTNTPVGIFLHNASRTTVRNNRIWLPSRVALWASMGHHDADWMTSNVFEDNEIAPVVQARPGRNRLPDLQIAQALWFWHARAGADALAPGRNHFRRNRVLELHGPVADFAWVRGAGEDRMYATAEWLAQQGSGWEMKRPASFVPVRPVTGPELVANSTFTGGLTQWRTWQAPSSFTFLAVPESNPTACVSSCLNFAAGHRGDLLASSVLSLKTGTPYVYRWTAIMPPSGVATVGASYISREGGPWDGMQDAQGFVGYTPRSGEPGARLAYESFFVAKENALARVNVQLETLGKLFRFETVSVKEVTGYEMAKTEDWARVVSSSEGAITSIDCQALGWPTGCSAVDGNGSPVSLPFVLLPGKTVLLLRSDSPFRR